MNYNTNIGKQMRGRYRKYLEITTNEQGLNREYDLGNFNKIKLSSASAVVPRKYDKVYYGKYSYKPNRK